MMTGKKFPPPMNQPNAPPRIALMPGHGDALQPVPLRAFGG